MKVCFYFLFSLFFTFGCTVSPPYYHGSTGVPAYPPGGNPNGPPGGNPNGPPGGNPNGPPGGNPNAPTGPYNGIGNLPPVGSRDLTFPYELIPDTLTALTCPQSVRIAGHPFTLSFGAYVDHGLQLSQEFLKKNDITRDTDPRRTRQLIERSPYKNVRARLAIQDESDLRRIYGKGNGQPLLAYFPPLNNPSTLDHLSRLRAVYTTRSASASAVGRGGKFEASLGMTGGELNYFAEGLAPSNPGVYILTLTYTMDGKSLILSDTSLPYGRGYKLEFADNYKATYLINVQEDHLPTTNKGGEWNCPEHLVFPIHQSESKERSPFNTQYPHYQQNDDPKRPEGYCDTGERPPLTERQARFFETIFGTSDLNKLPFKVGKTAIFEGDNFFDSNEVLTNETCIVFKKQGCYPRGYYRIEFDPNLLNDCVQYNNIQAPEDRYNICPAFLSVCYRVQDD